jgi:monomeric sarcosine oxidase
MAERFECIVIGAGAVGSAALLALARRGARALAIDRFPPGHDRGSSHGASRLIRLAYFEHPDYVPLLRRAYALWRELESACGETLLRETPLLQIGPEEGAVIPGVMASARRHGLKVERLGADEVRARFPGFAVPDGLGALLDAEAGMLAPEACVRAQAREAERAGAQVRIGEAVTRWKAEGDGVEVETDGGLYRADRLIVAPGAWAPALLPGLGVSLEVRRKSLFWYESPDACYAIESGCPAFLYELGPRAFYGFPAVDALGVKVAEHTGGERVADPLEVRREVDSGEARDIEAFLRAHLPRLGTRRTRHEVCLYTMSPDGHFLLGLHPRHERVALAAGLSGHGFKFAPVLGEALADLATKGATELPVGFLGPRRFATDV